MSEGDIIQRTRKRKNDKTREDPRRHLYFRVHAGRSVQIETRALAALVEGEQFAEGGDLEVAIGRLRGVWHLLGCAVLKFAGYLCELFFAS